VNGHGIKYAWWITNQNTSFGYLMAHQQLRSLEPGFDVDAVYCYTQDMASMRAINVPSAQTGY
jgi:hypothetical protein